MDNTSGLQTAVTIATAMESRLSLIIDTSIVSEGFQVIKHLTQWIVWFSSQVWREFFDLVSSMACKDATFTSIVSRASKSLTKLVIISIQGFVENAGNKKLAKVVISQGCRAAQTLLFSSCFVTFCLDSSFKVVTSTKWQLFVLTTEMTLKWLLQSQWSRSSGKYVVTYVAPRILEAVLRTSNVLGTVSVRLTSELIAAMVTFMTKTAIDQFQQVWDDISVQWNKSYFGYSYLKIIDVL